MIIDSKKKFLYVFLPIMAVIVAVISIVGGIVANNKSGELDLTPYLAVEASGSESTSDGTEKLNEVITYTVKGCNFSGTGTFIDIKSGTAYIVDGCTFTGSESSAIMVNNGALSISNSSFSNCSAVQGAAIRLDSSETTNTVLSIDGCTFDSCETSDVGGAICAYTSGIVDIKNSTFINNNSGLSGGAYYYWYKDYSGSNFTNIQNSRFLSNTAGSSGGAIFAYYVTMADSIVSDNTASYGGGVYLSASSGGFDTSSFTNCCIGEFSETITDENGLAQDVVYAGNVAADNGGGIYAGGGNVTIDGTTCIKSNKVTSSSSQGGGVYYNTWGSITIKGEAVIDSNESASNGGGLVINNGNSTISEMAIISNNTSGANGGGIYLNSSYTCTISGSVQITGNGATSLGGGICQSQGTLSISGAVISSNTANYGGGVHSSNRLELSGATLVTENTAGNGGGGVCSSSYLELLDSVSITSNAATAGDGGGLYWGYNANGQTVNFGNSTTAWSGKISENTAYQYGAGIYANGANITQYGGEISSNDFVNSSYTSCYGAGVYLCVPTTNASYTMYGSATIKENGKKYSFTNAGICLNSFSYGESYTYIASLIMNDESSITGNEAYNCNGGGVSLNKYSTLTMNDSSAISDNSTANDGGGIFSNGGIVTLNDNASIENNLAYRGCGIYSQDGTVNLNGSSSIKGNTIHPNTYFASICKGGGIHSYNSTLNLGTSSAHWTGEISGNESYNEGGGLYIYSSTNGSEYHQYGGKISGNKLNSPSTDQRFGAGVYITTDSSSTTSTYAMHGTAEISDNGVIEYADDGVTIENDYRAYDGGGIYLNNASFNMADTSMISGNNAIHDGGGVHMASSHGATYNNTAAIENNTAGNDGGGIYAGGKSVYLYHSFNIEGNTAGNDGGGVHGTFVLEMEDNSSITGNSATNNGGGAYISQFQLKNSASIKSNSANRGGGLYAINSSYLGTSSTDVWSGEIGENTAVKAGGGIYYQSSSPLYQYGGTISGNKLTSSTKTERLGAGVYITGLYHICENATISNNGPVVYGDDGTTITEDYRAYNGGGIYSTGTIRLNDTSIITTNNSSNNGGGIYSESGSVYITMGKVLSNTAGVNGGGVFVMNGSITANSGSTIESNTATSANGGGVYVGGNATATLLGLITYNTAGEYGGGVMADSSSTTTNASSGSITHNEATKDGGGLYLNKGSWNLSGSIITDNKASNGGGFCIVSTCTLGSLTNVNISNNTASSSGGGIYNNEASLTFYGEHVTMEGVASVGNSVTFNGNKAETGNGGAIFHYNAALTVNGSYDDASRTYSVVFTDNEAVSGGAIYNQSTSSYSANLNGCLISGNTATSGNGGGIYNSNSPLELSQTARVRFYDNTASNNGGAIASPYSNSNITIANTTDISSNTAGNYGGGVYLLRCELRISVATLIDSNTAKNGGGLCLAPGSHLKTRADVTVQQNTATQQGGGIYNAGTINTMSTNSIVSVNDNTSLLGGGMFLQNATYTGIKPIQVSGNHAKKADDSASDGAGIYLYSGNISNYEITQNYGHGLFIAAANSTVSNVRIDDNASSGVYVNATTTITNSEISNNEAQIGAGILHANNGTLTISGTTKIYGNVASSSGGGIYTTGGGNLVLDFDDTKYSDSADSLIYHTYGIFSNTATYGNGGGIFAVNSTITITNAGIYKNTAGNYGGGIHQESGTITHSAGNIYKNSANYGGGLYVHSGTFNLDVTLYSNSSRTDGGGIYAKGTVNLTTDVLSNSAAGNGGGICIASGGVICANDYVNVYNNTSSNYGGGISNSGLISVASGKALYVKQNTSTNQGGGMSVSRGLVDASGDYVRVFENTSTSTNIEGVYYYSCKTGDVLSRLKIYNHAGYGLGLSAPDSTIEDMEIYNQTVYGGVYVNASDATISDGVKIYDNFTDYDGGGIYFNGFITETAHRDLTITGSAHIYSNATNYINSTYAKGGGIYCYGGNLTISTDLDLDANGDYTAGVTNNEAYDMGAGIYAANKAVVILEKGYVAKNRFINPPSTYTFSRLGGGIFFQGHKLEIGVDGKIVENTENILYGGGIYLGTSSTMETTIIKGYIYGNTAQTNGGGIAALQGTSVDVYDNTATVSNNTAVNYFGGGIYANDADITVTSAVMSSNYANAGNGGAIYLTNTSTLNVQGACSFTGNTAISGGAIYSDGCEIRVASATFTSNQATADGGAIMIINTSASLIEFDADYAPSFNSNTATNFGGAIGLSSCASGAGSWANSVLIAGEFIGNATNGGNGGAIGIDNSSVYFVGQIYGGVNKVTVAASTNALYGGGIYVEATSEYYSSGDVVIYGCLAQVGGGIINLGTAYISGTINYCTAAMGGGAVNAGTLHLLGEIKNCQATAYSSQAANSIATISNLYIYSTAQIDRDICIAKASGILTSTKYGKIFVSDLPTDVFNLTFADVNTSTMKISSIGTTSGAFTYYAGYSRSLINFSEDQELELNASGESAHFTCDYGVIKKRTSNVDLYLYSS